MLHTDFAPSPLPAPPAAADKAAHAGVPLPLNTPVASVDAVVEALRMVFDPEIPVNIYDLGLVYDIRIAADGQTTIVMTLTAPACPVAGELPVQVAEVVAAVPGVGEADVFLVWEPPWTFDRLSDVARVALDWY
ncbi:MAG: hypothetical protein FD149_143 [Rhodospirillaceae bacterium]|nr:MAG: hypothetical protein FD149_143 [Rhodospirillaceae bacterium]